MYANCRYRREIILMGEKSGNKVIGSLDKFIVDTFKLDLTEGQPIYIGESNLNHMKSEHPKDFEVYGNKIKEIINNPDYIAKHPNKKNSAIEYIKVYKNANNEHVLVAVRATGKGTLFARTLFVMDSEKVEKYKNKNALIPYKK